MNSDSTTPTINLLNLLHQYTTLHTEATANLKNTYWNLTKARQKRGFQAGGGGFGGVEYSANDVREELRAQVVLEEGEPELVDEDNDDQCEHFRKFLLHFDGGKGIRSKRSEMPKTTEGLRRRGKASNETQVDSEWTNELTVEEEQLRSADPLTLFGVPPVALRVAQAQSRDAIAFYVEVANLAQEILRITNATKSDEK